MRPGLLRRWVAWCGPISILRGAFRSATDFCLRLAARTVRSARKFARRSGPSPRLCWLHSRRVKSGEEKSEQITALIFGAAYGTGGEPVRCGARRGDAGRRGPIWRRCCWTCWLPTHWPADRPLGQEILDVAQRQRVLHVHQHRQTNYLGRAQPKTTQPYDNALMSAIVGRRLVEGRERAGIIVIKRRPTSSSGRSRRSSYHADDDA